ncbi:hypothetical protein [Celeribacter ethanolicus]|uniref:Response regulatory domain-containing protein n=1 Tax=Celeribacter ethanolicus TaxID=1758178 RepID=A0A291GCA2_9RHOB|nr:hypothetical protein [Celeribacter ethanolicus]ATG48183.1 hypothetical protein CEW89_11780 [Celeribacter ethanolicus]TNE65742.1 MAG: hypothetical protein EP336_11560 [Paracoccaceae bacterium]
MFSHTAAPAVQNAVFLILAEDGSLGESLRLALLEIAPGAQVYRVESPGEAIVVLSRLAHVTAAFLALPAAELHAGVLGLRLSQRGARIVLLVSAPSPIPSNHDTLIWPQDPKALVALLNPAPC